MCWFTCALLMWFKNIFMTIRLLQCLWYLEVTVDEFVIHYYYWVLYCLAGVLQLDTLMKLDILPVMFNRFSIFNRFRKGILETKY